MRAIPNKPSVEPVTELQPPEGPLTQVVVTAVLLVALGSGVANKTGMEPPSGFGVVNEFRSTWFCSPAVGVLAGKLPTVYVLMTSNEAPAAKELATVQGYPFWQGPAELD